MNILIQKQLQLFFLFSLAFNNLIKASNLDTSFNHNGSTGNLFIADTVNQAQAITSQANAKIITVGNAGDNAVIVCYTNKGILDPTFNTNGTPGYIVINFGSPTFAYDLIIQPNDGKIIIVGFVTINNVDNALIARYNPDGTLDGSFNDVNGNNSGGYIITPFGAQTQLYSVKLQANGAIVVAGWTTYLGLANALVARYTNTGELDTTFNGIGYVTTLLGGVFTKARSLTLQPNGTITITGQAENAGVDEIFVYRYNNDGSDDTTLTTNFPLDTYFATCTAYDIALQSDTKIIIAGSSNEFDTSFLLQRFTIARLNSDGSLDTTFNAPSESNPDGTPGYIADFATGLIAQSLAIQSNDQILACGFNYNSNYVLVVVRYNPDGTVDPTFNFTVTNVTSNSLGNAIALQPDGKILVTGTVATPDINS